MCYNEVDVIVDSFSADPRRVSVLWRIARAFDDRFLSIVLASSFFLHEAVLVPPLLKTSVSMRANSSRIFAALAAGWPMGSFLH